MVTVGPLAIEAAAHVRAGDEAPALRPWMRAALWTVAGAILAGWAALAALHAGDDYRVAHTQGVWIAAAEAARAGRLYPPLFDGEHYSGTRYMPPAILLNAFAASLAGDALVGGKLLAAVLMGALLALVIVLLRKFDCPWPLSAALAASIVGTEAGLQAGTTVGGDLLPVVLQVAALAVASRAGRHSSMAFAGVLAGLAMASKLTGLWGALAIVAWLAAGRRWRPAATFAAACAGTAALVLGTVQLLTAGGLSEHLLAFSLAGVEGTRSFLRAPNQVLYNLRGHAIGAVVLLPLAALGALVAGGPRRLSVVHLSLGCALLLLLVVYADVGTGYNQLLDVVVLTALAVGHLAGRARESAAPGAGHVMLLAVAVAVMWAAGFDLVRTVAVDLRRDAAARLDGTPPARAAARVAAMVRPDQRLLAEDPSIDAALGRRPVIMDPFMINRLDRLDPAKVDPLIDAIADRRFDLVVLVVPLEDPALDFWWADYHFGPRVAGALRRSYRADGTVGRYYVYRRGP